MSTLDRLSATVRERGVEADLRMRIWNRDGAEAEMCGNGIRCVCKLAHERGLSRRTPMRIQTARGVLSLTYEVSATGSVESVTVGMGEPILDAARVPVGRRVGKPGIGQDAINKLLIEAAQSGQPRHAERRAGA